MNERDAMITDALVEVLERIAEAERRDGYEGPKIGRRLQLIYFSVARLHGDDREEVFEDRVVGKIGRTCDALELDLMIRSSQRGHHAIITKWKRVGLDRWRPIFGTEGEGDSLAIAVARAYLAAIGGDEGEKERGDNQAHVVLGDKAMARCDVGLPHRNDDLGGKALRKW